MLITLLVLMVMAVVTVGVLSVLNRDVAQVATNDKYQQLYNVSENQITNFVQLFGLSGTDIGTLPQTFSTCRSVAASNERKYECPLSDTNGAGFQVNTIMTVSDKKRIDDKAIRKDESFTIDLTAYRNALQIYWDRDAAVEILINYVIDTNGNRVWDTGEVVNTVKDIFDRASVYDSLVGQNPYSVSILNFSPVGGANQNRSFRFTVGAIDGFAANYLPLTLTIIPRSKSLTTESIIFDIEPIDYSSFPYQLRTFNSASFDAADPSTPLAIVETTVPIAPQTDSIFNYSLLTNDSFQIF